MKKKVVISNNKNGKKRSALTDDQNYSESDARN